MPLMNVVMIKDGENSLEVMTPILKQSGYNLADVLLRRTMNGNSRPHASNRTGIHNKPDGSSASTTSQVFLKASMLMGFR